MKYKTPIILTLSILALLVLDQISKYLALAYLKGNAPIELIPGIFELHYLENTGAAFGSFLGKTTFLSIVTLAIVIYMIWKLVQMPKSKHFMPLASCLCLLIAGGLGNLIDRAFRSFVVDFFYFKPINFPIFNVADIFVCIGVFGLIVATFLYKEHEMQFLWEFKKSK